MRDFVKLATPGVQGLHPYQPGKPIEELQRERGLMEIIKLASNENPLGSSPLGQQAAQVALSGLNIYPDDSGFHLRHCLAGKLQVEPENILLGAGSSDVISMVAQTFLMQGCNAVFSEHAFAMYAIYTQAAGAKAKIAAPMPADHAGMPYGHDLEKMYALIDDQTRVIFIANPNNPTGTWLTASALKAFVEQVPSDIVIVLDEAYTEYVDDPEFPNGIDWIGRFPNLIVTRTFSKIYGLAALRVGYGVANPDLVQVINRVRAPFNVNSVALAAAEAALDDEVFLQKSIDSNRRGLIQLAEGFAQLGLPVIPSVGNFICADMRQSAASLFDALLSEGVIVRPVGNYSMPNHLRVTVGTARENEIALAAIQKVLQ